MRQHHEYPRHTVGVKGGDIVFVFGGPAYVYAEAREIELFGVQYRVSARLYLQGNGTWSITDIHGTRNSYVGNYNHAHLSQAAYKAFQASVVEALTALVKLRPYVLKLAAEAERHNKLADLEEKVHEAQEALNKAKAALAEAESAS